VETALSQHPAIAKVLVVGIPDTRLSEKVVACVIIKDKWKWVNAKPNRLLLKDEVSDKALRDHCIKRNLTRYFVNEQFSFKFSYISIYNFKCTIAIYFSWKEFILIFISFFFLAGFFLQI
jgi:acyl-CoA synthetase (AMP-forming)/AMP-acid ligase II